MKHFQNTASIFDYFQVNFKQHKWLKRWKLIFYLLYINIEKIEYLI